VCSRVETVLESTTQETMRLELGNGKKYRESAVEEAERKDLLTARHRGAERAKAGKVFELHRVFSCCLGDRRWRTELDFSGREPLKDLHRSTAFRAGPSIE